MDLTWLAAKYVPIPAYEHIRTSETVKWGTHLVVAQLLLDVIFFQKRIQLDHVCNSTIV
jgi:hypothetical protein